MHTLPAKAMRNMQQTKTSNSVIIHYTQHALTANYIVHGVNQAVALQSTQLNNWKI